MTATINGVDPRGYSPTPLPKHPVLPVISRKALRRVKDRMDIPCTCRYCGGPVELVNNDHIYGRSFGEWPYMYLCTPCDAYVGVHKYTDLPLGTIANLELRGWRKAAKKPFAMFVDRLGRDRTLAYTVLATRMGIPKEACHFGMFEVEECREAMACLAIINAELD